MTDITAIGELLIDFTSENSAERLYSANPGGAPANFAVAAAKAGAKTAMVAKVGADGFGRLLIKTLADAGVETDGILLDETVFTTLAFVTVDAAGERSFSFARKPGADTCLRASELPYSLLEQTRALHFGSLSFTDEPACSAVTQAVNYAKERGALISYDPNYRPPLWESEAAAVDAMRRGLALADVVKLSEEEAALLTGETDAAAAAQAILKTYGCRLVFVTLGARGCFFANSRCSGYVPALPGVKPVDTTGAGDIFGGTALARLLTLDAPPESLEEKDVRAVCMYACTAAGLSTAQRGGIASVPEKEKTEKFLQNYGKSI